MKVIADNINVKLLRQRGRRDGCHRRSGCNGSPDADKEGYRLVWRDEFNGASLDTAKRGDQTGIKDIYGSSVGPDYWGNSELQYYTEDAVSVADLS